MDTKTQEQYAETFRGLHHLIPLPGGIPADLGCDDIHSGKLCCACARDQRSVRRAAAWPLIGGRQPNTTDGRCFCDGSRHDLVVVWLIQTRKMNVAGSALRLCRACSGSRSSIVNLSSERRSIIRERNACAVDAQLVIAQFLLGGADSRDNASHPARVRKPQRDSYAHLSGRPQGIGKAS